MKQYIVLSGLFVLAVGYLLYKEFKHLEDVQSLLAEEINSLKKYHMSESSPTLVYEDDDDEDEGETEEKEEQCSAESVPVEATVVSELPKKLETVDEIVSFDEAPEDITLELKDDKILNPKTGRLIKKDSPLGKRLLKEQEIGTKEKVEIGHESSEK